MFYELESWRTQPDRQADAAEIIRAWFGYVRAHQGELFTEWRSVRYFREVQREAAVDTGRYIMQFGFDSRDGFLAYKERRKDWSGPYAAYKTYDPYPLFVESSVDISYWTERDPHQWVTWQASDTGSFFDVVSWSPLPGRQAAHDETMRQWFDFVRRNHDDLFAEWRAVRYYQGQDRQTGAARDRFMMIFEYNHREGFLAYKERRRDYAGPYAEYLKIDPFVHFDEETKTVEYWQPEELDLWLDW
jgi:hypothetical protein